MSASKRPSTSSLRRFITSRPYVTVAELRRRFGLDDPDAMAHIQRNGTSAWIGLPEREATKLQELWDREELGMELSVEVHAPVVVGIYPMRVARYVVDGARGAAPTAPATNGATYGADQSHAASNAGYPSRGQGPGRRWYPGQQRLVDWGRPGPHEPPSAPSVRPPAE